jgi:hypothetical protein
MRTIDSEALSSPLLEYLETALFSLGGQYLVKSGLPLGRRIAKQLDVSLLIVDFPVLAPGNRLHDRLSDVTGDAWEAINVKLIA